MNLIIVITILFSIAWAETYTPFHDVFYLLTDKCQTTVVEMNSGTIKTAEGEAMWAKCVPLNDKISVKCSFENKGKKHRDVLYKGGIISSDGILHVSNIEQYHINMITRIFHSDSFVSMDNGRIRGSKVCAGRLVFDKELKEDKSEKKAGK